MKSMCCVGEVIWVVPVAGPEDKNILSEAQKMESGVLSTKNTDPTLLGCLLSLVDILHFLVPEGA